MKKSCILIMFTIFSLFLITACTGNTVTKRTSLKASSMIRSIGIGENAMPIEAESFAIEFFNDEGISVDRIDEKVVSYTGTPVPGEELPEDEYSLTGRTSDKDFRSFGFNGRYGFDDYTELKVGFFTGSVKNGYSRSSSTVSNEYNESSTSGGLGAKYYTSILGTQFALKQLLLDYNTPQRLSLYLNGRYTSTKSRDTVSRYDGNVIEVKSALIYGYLVDPLKRTFPSLALYYSRAYTYRDETIPGIPLKNQIEAVGLEANISVDLKHLYYLIYLGVEKDLAEDNDSGLNGFFGVKLGINFNRKKLISLENGGE